MSPDERSSSTDLHGSLVFISASIPDERRWTEGEFDPLEITEATLAVTRSVLAPGGRILFGGHPTISPLILSVAQRFSSLSRKGERPLVTVYQSELFADQIPDATLEIAEKGIGRIEYVPAVDGDSVTEGRVGRSMGALRNTMIDPNREPGDRPIAAFFIGGMYGINQEYSLVAERFPDVPRYAFGRPGGVAAKLARLNHPVPAQIAELLVNSREYGSIMDEIMANLAQGA